ncbi:MAG TPA: response regulator [Steroidobacter sp.]
MNADAIAARMSVLTRALPPRVLVVDDDELESELIVERLTAAGFEVARARHGSEALELLDSRWYPLVITDWQMPVMDGIRLTEALRAKGVCDTYVIMLTMREASVDYERGYLAGVDDYLSKRVPDAELFARIHAGFNTLALRRSLRQMQATLEESVSIDAESGAFSSQELVSRLRGEIRRAQRYGRQLCIITVGIRSARAQGLNGQMRKLVQTIDAVVRAHIDWIGRLPAAPEAAFAVVLPEAGISEAPFIKERIAAALKGWVQREEVGELELTFGVAALERGSTQETELEAEQMLKVAETCRRCTGCNGPEQLAAVQASVASQVAIVCRHGYVVDTSCRLKGEAAAGPGEPGATG